MENLEYIFPQDLKMWAKSAGRKFLEAQEKIKALSTKNISASAYWDENSNVVVVSDDGVIKEYFK
tara:strand:+ start:348 stop:542 length:195 start_codon:yes stop_codon:yes gene_type:complete